ncbi:MAG: amino acid adenylation domain-containing protein [Clostridia bacterium]|nr:amino acid adenylation domain-containing protein [Clostridia bacterium]
MSKDEILQERKARLSAEKLALLEKLKGFKSDTAATAIQPRPGNEPVPLSYAQQRLWFLDQLVPNNPAYNAIVEFCMSGEVDTVILEKCINEIISRHEALRTTFKSINGQAYQEISPKLELKLPVADLREYSDSEMEKQMQKLKTVEGRHVFDLTKGPLIRTLLCRLDENRHILLVNIHHIVVDGWSIGLLLKELMTLYMAFSAGKPSPLPALPIQYSDFSVWQRKWLQGEIIQSQLSYWKEKLGKERSALELPADRVRPPIQSFRGGNIKFRIPPSVTKRIKELCEQENATLFMILITALKVLLYRYTNQEVIMVGTPIANRNRVEVENLIGFFVNTIVLKTDLSGNPSFRELLGRVREEANDAYKHQDLPFEVLVDELQPERNLSQNPLFQVCFVLQNIPMPKRTEVSELKLSVDAINEVRNDTSKFDLWIEVIDKVDYLDADVEYNSDIFNESTVARILESYKILLQGIASNPEKGIAYLPVMSEEEKQKLLYEWNDTAVVYPQGDMCLHEIIERQVDRTPDAPAVLFQDNKLTYKELDRKANQMASYLIKKGVGPETLVGICMERSLELIVSLLGILKAGGAYVPLDPSYPAERLAFMLEDSKPPLILTQLKLANTISANNSEVVCIDADMEVLSCESQDGSGCRTASGNLAYMIYTSGSTGKPKGAMNTHKGIVNRLLWMQEEYGLNETDRVLQKTPFSFDVSVWEFFWPLITGACMVLAKPEGHKDPSYLSRLIQKEGITTIHFVPSMLQVFLEEEGIENCDTLKRVISSGEALSFSTQELFHKRLKAGLHNLYGPTEAAVDVTYWACRRGSEQRMVPIGRPVANTQIYILDKNLNPVPTGVPGELHIGGIQVARGYHNRPELTEEKFIPDPFSGEEGARLYKTGDLARYLPDGNIEYVGRIDFQVKIRGIRIELGEIEAVLEEHPGVQKAAVVVQEYEHMPDHKQLVAYVISDLQERAEEKGLPAENLHDSQVSEWETVFDKAYKTNTENIEADFNISSWNSSYTGLPLLAEEMREWVDAIVGRILALKPEKVLEIGCGTGLLLSRIAPRCDKYWGSDISSMVLDYVRNNLIEKRKDLSHVKLLRKNADDFSVFDDEGFNVVVLNSVVQYFPDVNYFLSVLKKAVQMVNHNGGGAVFLGDIRNFSLLETFHTDIELEKALSSLTIEQLKQRVSKRIRQEQELLIDPEFFLALKEQLSEISHVEVQLKRGKYHNELTRYRYDVILHVGGSPAAEREAINFDWHKEDMNIDRLEEILKNDPPELLHITNIPNARNQSVNRKLSILKKLEPGENVEKIRHICSLQDQDEGVDPETIWGLCDRLDYGADIVWCSGAADGSYEITLKHKSVLQQNPAVIAQSGLKKNYHRLDSYANNPLLDRIANRLVPELRGYLKEKLPDHMIPSSFVVIKEMPVNSNGKLDRKALPAPVVELPDSGENIMAPVTPAEKILAEVWAEVLGLERVGTNNNFFSLGGDSIHSIRVVARAKQKGVEITPQHMFKYQTISELAAALESETCTGELQVQDDFSGFDYSERDRKKIKEILSSGDIEDVYPLAPFQEHMLNRYLSSPETGLFLVQNMMIVPFSGGWDIDFYENVWQALVDRHEALRTSFVWEELDKPLQLVHKNVKISLAYEDWREISEEMRDARLEEFLKDDRTRGIELGKPRGIRVFIGQMQDCSLLLFSFSYMCLDGWSFNTIFDEFDKILNAFLKGQTVNLKQIRKYKDCVAIIQKEDLSQIRAFWENKLRDFDRPTPLASGIPGNKPDNESGFARQCIKMSRETSDKLRQLAREYRLTLGTLVQGTWSLIQSYYSRRNDIVYGIIINGRPVALKGVEDMVGPFLNIIPLRVRISSSDLLLEWLKNLMAQIVELSRYQNTPLRRLQEWNLIPADRPFAQNYLVFQNATVEELNAKTPNHFFVSKMGFPLRVDLYPESELALHMSYYRNVFNDESISCLIRNFQQVLEDILVNPVQKRISDICDLIEMPPKDSIRNPRVFYEGKLRIDDIKG